MRYEHYSARSAHATRRTGPAPWRIEQLRNIERILDERETRSPSPMISGATPSSPGRSTSSRLR